MGYHNACGQRWFEFLTAFDYTLEYRTCSANGNANFLYRFPDPATEHDRSASSSFTLVHDDGTLFIRACGLRTRSSKTPYVGLGGVPRPENAVLGGLPFASSEFRDSSAHGLQIRIYDISSPLGDSLLVRLPQSLPSIAAPAAEQFFLPHTPLLLRFLPCLLRAARALQKSPLPRRLSTSVLLTGSRFRRDH